jgi:hypothetical protein
MKQAWGRRNVLHHTFFSQFTGRIEVGILVNLVMPSQPSINGNLSPPLINNRQDVFTAFTAMKLQLPIFY